VPGTLLPKQPGALPKTRFSELLTCSLGRVLEKALDVIPHWLRKCGITPPVTLRTCLPEQLILELCGM
jgi:hypothetical protein